MCLWNSLAMETKIQWNCKNLFRRHCQKGSRYRLNQLQHDCKVIVQGLCNGPGLYSNFPNKHLGSHKESEQHYRYDKGIHPNPGNKGSNNGRNWKENLSLKGNESNKWINKHKQCLNSYSERTHMYRIIVIVQ